MTSIALSACLHVNYLQEHKIMSCTDVVCLFRVIDLHQVMAKQVCESVTVSESERLTRALAVESLSNNTKK